MTCSSGRESFFNLNSTWYDPAGSWLDTRRTPLRYAYGPGCAAHCSRGGDSCQGGHDHRHYGYRRSVCSETCRSSSAPCLGNGSSQCARTSARSYGSSGRYLSGRRVVCAERCREPSGPCRGNRDSVCIAQPASCCGSAGGRQGGVGAACPEGYRGCGCAWGPTHSCGAYGGSHSHGAPVCLGGCQGIYAGCHN